MVKKTRIAIFVVFAFPSMTVSLYTRLRLTQEECSFERPRLQVQT